MKVLSMENVRDDLDQLPQLGAIRAAVSEDAKAILDIYSPYIHDTGVSFETSLPSLSEIECRIMENSKLGYFVCELNGQVIGYAYASRHRQRAAYQWCCEISAYVKENFHGKKVASQLYSRLFHQLRDLGYVNAYAGITLPNEKSVRFHEAMGFKHIGTYEKIGFKLERWHDVGWWGLRLQQPPIIPEKPALNQDGNFENIIHTSPTIARSFSGAPWEKKLGYCRAIRMGNTIAVTGTAPVNEEGKVFAVGKPFEQARRCLEIIEKAIRPLGATRKNIIRTRIFVTDIKHWQEFGRAHSEFFADHPPATTMVEVKALIDPDMMVEIEADANLSNELFLQNETFHKKKLNLEVSPETLAICRLEPNATIPSWAVSSSFFSTTRTPEELSIVCSQDDVPQTIKAEREWCSLKVQGTLDFELTGILASLTEPLAANDISVFSISTFDTDYLLIRRSDLAYTIEILTKAGHQIKNGGLFEGRPSGNDSSISIFLFTISFLTSRSMSAATICARYSTNLGAATRKFFLSHSGTRKVLKKILHYRRTGY